MFHNPLDNRALYSIYDVTMRLLQPYSDYCAMMAKKYRRVSDTFELPVHIPYLVGPQKELYASLLKLLSNQNRRLAATYYIHYMCTATYEKPKFDINEIKMGDEYCDISEVVINRESFCNLLHFKKLDKRFQDMPKMLLVAPMSGHYATLLRDTVKCLLPYYDVYITEWINARDVPLTEGSFDLDDFVDYIISYCRLLGPDFSIMAVCQPTVPVLIALSLMSSAKDPCLPRAAILLGGPIDTTQSPTTVNQLATSRGGDWFQQNVISMVPGHFPGAMRLVYPGFMQLAGFISMNLQSHIESLNNAINEYADNKKESAFKIVKFYAEYFATMDLTAEFYMQTINTVFQEKLIATGRYKSRGHTIRLEDITDTAILAIEGERDDITGVGQTKAVLKFCKNLSNTKKEYFLAKDVGHYGLFNGSKFRKYIIPVIMKFTDKHKGHKDIITK